jgi:hypothetical protein
MSIGLIKRTSRNPALVLGGGVFAAAALIRMGTGEWPLPADCGPARSRLSPMAHLPATSDWVWRYEPRLSKVVEKWILQGKPHSEIAQIEFTELMRRWKEVAGDRPLYLESVRISVPLRPAEDEHERPESPKALQDAWDRTPFGSQSRLNEAVTIEVITPSGEKQFLNCEQLVRRWPEVIGGRLSLDSVKANGKSSAIAMDSGIFRQAAARSRIVVRRWEAEPGDIEVLRWLLAGIHEDRAPKIPLGVHLEPMGQATCGHDD